MHTLLASRAPLLITRVVPIFTSATTSTTTTSAVAITSNINNCSNSKGVGPRCTNLRAVNRNNHNNNLRRIGMNTTSGGGVSLAGDDRQSSYTVDAVFAASGGATSDDTAVAEAIAKHNFKIILGSKSFTRKAILTEMGVSYDVVTADIDEKAIRRDDPEDLVMSLALAKADAIVSQRLEKKAKGGTNNSSDDKNASEGKGEGEGGGGSVSASETRTLLITSDQVVVHEGKGMEGR